MPVSHPHRKLFRLIRRAIYRCNYSRVIDLICSRRCHGKPSTNASNCSRVIAMVEASCGPSTLLCVEPAGLGRRADEAASGRVAALAHAKHGGGEFIALTMPQHSAPVAAADIRIELRRGTAPRR